MPFHLFSLQGSGSDDSSSSDSASDSGDNNGNNDSGDSSSDSGSDQVIQETEMRMILVIHRQVVRHRLRDSFTVNEQVSLQLVYRKYTFD